MTKTPIRLLAAAALLFVCAAAFAHSSMDLSVTVDAPPFLRASQTERVTVTAHVNAFDPAAAVVVTVDTNAQFTAVAADSLWRCTRESKRVRCTADEINPGPHSFGVDVATPSSGSVTISADITSIASSDPNGSNDETSTSSRVYASASCGDPAPAVLTASTSVGLTELAWTTSARASRYEVFAATDGEEPHVVATTTAARASVRFAGGGDVEWFVRAVFDDCPAADSGIGAFVHPGAAARLLVESIVSPLLSEPVAVTVDVDGVLVADAGAHAIRYYFTDARVLLDERLIGESGAPPVVADGGIAIGPGRYLYIADRSNHYVRFAFPSPRAVFGAAGTAQSAGSQDGAGTAARFRSPVGIAVDARAQIYIADSGNHTIRRATFDVSKGQFAVITFAGAAGQSGAGDGTGGAARFNDPAGLAFDGDGNLLVADRGNHLIRRITPGGVVSTIAGVAGEAGHRDGAALQALFNRPIGVAVDPWGNVLVTEEENHTVRKIAPNGRVTTVAGTPRVAGDSDGLGEVAQFRRPSLLAIDGNGVVWIPDAGNGKLRRAVFAAVAPKRRAVR